MLSIGLYDYRLSKDEFWRLTPAQFHAIGKRFDVERKHQDQGFGIVSSVIANCHRNPKKQKKPFVAEDFMPVYQAKKKSPKSLKMYWDSVVVPQAAYAAKQAEEKAKRGKR